MHAFTSVFRTPRWVALFAFALVACATSAPQSEVDRNGDNAGRPDRDLPGSDAGRGDEDDVTPAADVVDSDANGTDSEVGDSDVVVDPNDAIVDTGADTTATDASPDASTPDTGADVLVPADVAQDAVAEVSSDVGVGVDVDLTDTGVAACATGSTRACYTGSAAVAGVGACVSGVERCDAGVWGACEGWVAPVAEVCGDARDNDCDAETDEGCTTACSAPTRVISNIENDDVHDLFLARGLSLQEPFSVNATHFAGNDVVLVDALYASSSLTPAAVNAFLDRGGTAIFFTTSISTSCNRINSDNLNGTGLSLSCSPGATGSVSNLPGHPLTEGMATGQFPTAFSASVTGGTPIAQVGSLTIAAALERGCGRLLVVGNGDLADDFYWPTTSAFWSNAVGWLVDRP